MIFAPHPVNLTKSQLWLGLEGFMRLCAFACVLGGARNGGYPLPTGPPEALLRPVAHSLRKASGDYQSTAVVILVGTNSG